MIRARITLTDGITPGPIRYGTSILMACFARGCRIVPDPLNQYPDDFKEYELGGEVPAEQLERPKRGRPKKTQLSG